jgi:hypothetical protein
MYILDLIIKKRHESRGGIFGKRKRTSGGHKRG